jgi:outer membrane protein TolC
MTRRLATAAMLAASALAAGCATLSPDAGMGAVQDLTTRSVRKDVIKAENDADAAEIKERTRSLLTRQLSADDAVQLALLNNRGLQAAFAELGAAEAQGVEASLPPSPTFSIARIVATGQLEIERQVLQNILGLITLPRRREIAEARFRQAQLRAANEALILAAQTRRAYFRAVAATHAIVFLEEALSSAQATSELAKRLGQTGALNKLDQAREHAFTADLGGQLATARLRARTERERLTRLMGLWGGDVAFRLPKRLPALPARAKAVADLERQALERRLDIHMARAEIDALAVQLGLTQHTRFINVLELRGMDKVEKSKKIVAGPSGPEAEVERTHWRGIELELQVPLFDYGAARTRNAEQLYMQAVHRLAERAVNARSEVREAYQSYRGTYDIARHYQREVLPLRKVISDETLLRYNAMLTDLFLLLADARARVASNSAAIDALREYWLATVDLEAAIVGGGTSGAGTTAPSAMSASDAGPGH